MYARRTAAILAIVGALAVGCGQMVQLPTIASDGSACRGVGLDGVLRGSADDPRVAWLDSNVLGSAKRIEVVFPAGFSARFGPSLQILDGDGRVVALAGDTITGGCVTGPDAAGPILILGVGSSDLHRR